MNDLQDRVEALELVLENLQVKDKGFAVSLVSQYKSRGGLSDKQAAWVDKLRHMAMGQVDAPPTPKEVGSFSGVYALFAKAKQKLKAPKIYLMVKDIPIILYLSGKASKVPDTVNVTGEGQYPNRKWYGRVAKEGTWTSGQLVYPEAPEVEKVLKSLSRDPAKAAKSCATLTGRCCFCGLPLSDESSLLLALVRLVLLTGGYWQNGKQR